MITHAHSLAQTFTLPEASKLFKDSHNQLLQALNFFVLDGFVTEHINIQMDIASLYEAMTVFYDESDLSSQAKLHKRIANILEPIIPQLNPQNYRNIIGEMAHEVGEAYNRLADIKIAQAHQITAEIQKLVQQTNNEMKAIEKEKKKIKDKDDQEKEKEKQKEIDITEKFKESTVKQQNLNKQIAQSLALVNEYSAKV
ncbi:MAG: hypothetical protein EZS28_043622 [Streblomastix strix]|uniref:KIF-binding protein n=1 Tax=Streblomastix strix TaxID=222440 RepID=A0A5J4TTL4_9EUKA|nr:MAG: hypothetical protein EZS28_043622 [Streblomastix strix]